MDKNYQDEIIPMPKGTEIYGKEIIGIKRCRCGEYRSVRPNKKGVPTAWCDTHLTVRGCTRSEKLNVSDIPSQTLENFESHDASNIPDEYQAALNQAWEISEKVENSKQDQEGIKNVSKDDQVESSGNSGKSETGKSRKTKRVRGLI